MKTGRCIRLAAWGLLGLLIPACGGGGGGGGGAAPVPPFAVAFVKPDPSPSVTPRQTEIYVRFNRDFNQATVTPATFDVSGPGGPVAGSFSFTHALSEIRFVPTAALSGSALYSVTLSSGIQDLAGRALTPATFTFTTGAATDTDRPTFAGATGATAASTSQIDLTWAAATDASAVTYEVFLSLTPGVFDFTSPDYTTASGTGYSVTGLSSNLTCYFVVRARDAGGNTDLNSVQVSAKTRTSWASDVFAGIFQGQCRSCHISGQEAFTAGLTDLDFNTAATAYAGLVNIDIWVTPLSAPMGAKRVVPSNVSLSFLHNKVDAKRQGVPPWGGVGMPKTGGTLSQAQIDTIASWISEGALNN